MSDFDDCQMDGEQAECASRVRELWASHAPLEQEAHALRGGIIWKKARGHDYLFRYFQDPLTGTKRFESKGRRSPDTEAEHARYLARRGRVQDLFAQSSEQVETVGRVARAFRLARFPATPAAVIRGLWLEGCFDEGLRLMGATAMFGYELEGEFLAPSALVRGESLRILASGAIDDRLAAFTTRLVTAADRDFSLVRHDRDHLVYDGGRGGRIELYSIAALSSYLADRGVGRDRVDMVMDAVALPAWRGVAVARDARVLQLNSIDPRAHALLTHATAVTERDGNRAELLARRANLMAWAIRERMGLTFSDSQAEAFSDLVEDDEGDLWQAPRI